MSAEPAPEERFPRASHYPEAWAAVEPMGPHVLWLTEWLSEAMTLQPGMRVLDLGCGRAYSSMFLAREFGVQVWAADLWVRPSENLGRIRAEGIEGQVFPLHVEAHQLPFANEFFDAILSVDAYHYFGTSELYLGHILRFLRPGGEIGIAVPGLRNEMEELPPELAAHWDPDFWTFHSPGWWRRHWERTGLVDVTAADMLEDGVALWLEWLAMAEANGFAAPGERRLLEADRGRWLGFTRAVARKR